MPLALDVLVPLPLPPLSYLPPLDRPLGPVGARVVVPWQGGVRVGLLVGTREVPAGRGLELKEAVDWLDATAFVSEDAVVALLRTARQAAVPPGLVLAGFLPSGFQPELRHEVRAVDEAAARAAELEGDGWVEAARVPAERLAWLRGQGLLHERAVRVPATVRMLVPRSPLDDGLSGARRASQRTALERLWLDERADSAAALARDAGVPESAVRSLVRKGYAAYDDVEAPPPPLPRLAVGAEPPPVDPSLEAAPEGSGAVVGGRRSDRLARVRARLAGDLEAGRSALVLVPEQGLLEETCAGLAGLPLHHLAGDSTDAQRERLFAELAAGGAVILVGTYLALLAPLPALGRVVVLEAGSASYKLPSGSRAFVPNAAALRAEAAGAALTVTDPFAGPELLARVPADRRLALGLPRLRVHVADMNGSANWPLHPDLVRVLRQVEERGRQAVVIAPRRGFSAALGCADCGWMAHCPNCDLTLRFHRQDARLRCHQCGYEEAPPERCPSCGGVELAPLRGAGTQWVASQLAGVAPGLPVVRMDRDRRDDLGPLLAGRPGVVVGTTAALRLPPLPALSLLAVTLFDTHLGSADFRAEEEALRMLLQLAELATDRRPLLVVQTYQAQHAVLEALRAPEPEAAVEVLVGRWLERRRRFGYPPFSALAKLQLSARERGTAAAAADALVGELRGRGAAAEDVLGPAPAPVARVRGRYAYQVLLRAEAPEALEEQLADLPARIRGAQVRVDVDPRDVGELLE